MKKLKELLQKNLEQLTVQGNIFIHVIDLADAHILALKYLREGGESNVFYLGNGQGFSVKEIIVVAEKISGQKIKPEIGARCRIYT